MASVDGQRTHLLHVRSPQEDALPLVLIHGWPSSPVEFLRVLDALTDPAASGGDPADAFHVVVPGLPGYGLSTPLAGPGWGNLYRVGFAWTDLLTALGYERFGSTPPTPAPASRARSPWLHPSASWVCT